MPSAAPFEFVDAPKTALAGAASTHASNICNHRNLTAGTAGVLVSGKDADSHACQAALRRPAHLHLDAPHMGLPV